MPTRDQARILTCLAPYEKSKFLGSGGSMVAGLKLKGIDAETWDSRIVLERHGKAGQSA